MILFIIEPDATFALRKTKSKNHQFLLGKLLGTRKNPHVIDAGLKGVMQVNC
jgi:hypothetical protein